MFFYGHEIVKEWKYRAATTWREVTNARTSCVQTQEGRAGWLGPPFLRLEAGYVCCLQALGAAGNFKFNRLAFVQRFVPFRLNCGKVDENVLAGLALDEPIPFAGIEPLHCSLFSH
jgi:hypothetical protein